MKTNLILSLALLTATPMFAVVDQNNNSLSDVYEFIYFGGPTDPFAAPDGDGVTTYDEMFWGTNPTNAASKVTGPAATLTGSDLALSWPVAPYRTYELQVSTDLQTWQTVTNGPVSLYIEHLAAPGASPSRFFRLLVTLDSQNTNALGLADWEAALYEQHFGDPHTSTADIDGDGLPDGQEFQQGHNFLKKDHPAVGLLVFSPLER